jgi:DNA-binding NarL/FixJ family response regulator
VLVVDDHAGFREMARALAVSGGPEVVAEAADGATALTLCRQHHPDLVLLDIGLPDLDGFAVAERMAGDGAPDVVLISSRDRAVYADRIDASPAIGYIAKGDLDGAALRALLRIAAAGS